MCNTDRGILNMKTVSESEFQKNFGAFKEMAQREPITVTSNGRESVVLISAAEYAAFLKLKCAYNGQVNKAFEDDLTTHFDEHKDVHKGLSR